MRSHTAIHPRERGFSICGLGMFILVAFLAVSVGHAIWAHTQSGWPTSKWLLFVMVQVVFPLVLAVAITMTAYFLSRKSNGFANATLCTLLLIMIGGRVGLWTGLIPKDFSFRKPFPSGAAAATTPAPVEGGSVNPAAVRPSSRPLPSAVEASDSVAVAPISSGADVNLPIAPSDQAIPEAPSSPAFKDVAAWIALKEPRTADALTPLAAELDGSVEEILDKAGLCVDSLAKTGRPSNKTLDERIALADAGKQLAEALADRLFRLNEEASRVLKGSRASVSAHNFAFHSAAGARSIAARQYADFFAALSQQSALLRNNPSKWSLNSDGTINANDAKLRIDLHGPTFGIEVFLQREKDYKVQLTGR